MSGDENRDAYDGDALPRRRRRRRPLARRLRRADDRGQRVPGTAMGGDQGGRARRLPIIFGLIVIVIIFGTLEDQFLTARNFTNLLLQMAPVAALAMGIVFILLIADGEVVSIDLSVAFVAATGGVVMTSPPAAG